MDPLVRAYGVPELCRKLWPGGEGIFGTHRHTMPGYSKIRMKRPTVPLIHDR